MSTKKSRKENGLTPVCGYVNKDDLHTIKNILGERGWQERLLNRTLDITVAYIKNASRDEIIQFLWNDEQDKFYLERRP